MLQSMLVVHVFKNFSGDRLSSQSFYVLLPAVQWLIANVFGVSVFFQYRTLTAVYSDTRKFP